MIKIQKKQFLYFLDKTEFNLKNDTKKLFKNWTFICYLSISKHVDILSYTAYNISD